MKLIFCSFAVCFFFFSCSQRAPVSIDSTAELQFEVVDSIKVNVLDDLLIMDYLESSDKYLMKERKGGKIYLVDGKGSVISTQDIGGEGPNQVSIVWEGRFFGEDGYIFKEMSATMDFHVYDHDFQKTEKIRGPAVGLNAIFISFYRQTFHVFETGGEKYILGEEVNAFDAGTIDPLKLGGDFYNKAKTGYFYDLSQDSITYLNLFPKNWEPRKSNQWAGQSFPFLTFDPKNSKVTVLPPMGDALYSYELNGNSMQNETQVNLTHPDRTQPIPDPSRENQLYPSFSDLKTFGEYQLAIFNTAIPEEIYQEFRAKGEDYYRDPEWPNVLAKYRTPRYIVIKDGMQVGIVQNLPIDGNVNLGLADGSILVKATDGEVERDYNLFYRLKLVGK